MDPGRHHGEYKICHESQKCNSVGRKSHSIISNLVARKLARAPLPRSFKVKIGELLHCCPQLSQPIVPENILFAVSPLLKIDCGDTKLGHSMPTTISSGHGTLLSIDLKDLYPESSHAGCSALLDADASLSKATIAQSSLSFTCPYCVKRSHSGHKMRLPLCHGFLSSYNFIPLPFQICVCIVS